MWIARMENGTTFNKKNTDFLCIEHNKIVSLQLLFGGKYFTLTRGNKTQPLIVENISYSNLPLSGKGKVTHGHLGVRIYCIKNSWGHATGWQINYKTANVSFFEMILFEPRTGLYNYNFCQDEIIDSGHVKLCLYEMKKE